MQELFSNNYLLWIVNISYFLGLFPQVILNYKMKTTKALSDLYLMGYLGGYVLNLLYVYALNFDLAYKTRAILSLLVVGFILFQRFFYRDKYQLKVYLIGGFILLMFIPLLFVNSKLAGHLAGWSLFFIWSTYQLPQVFKNYKRKSVEGFSFLLVSLICLGNLFEFVMGAILHYPEQSQFIAIRGIVISMIFYSQFWMYGKNSEKVINVKTVNVKKVNFFE